MCTYCHKPVLDEDQWHDEHLPVKKYTDRTCSLSGHDKNKPIKIVVPIHVQNTEECVGVRTDGGMITQVVTEIEIIALPKDLPESLEIDAENLHLGETLHLSDIKMPAGVELTAMQNVEETEHDDHDLGVDLS